MAFGNALVLFTMAIALIGLVVFPIRYYRRRANPLRVARNLLISNITFAVMLAIGGSLAPDDLTEEGETVNEARLYFAAGSFIIACLIACMSLAIFFALSRARAKRELHSNMETV